MDKRINSRTLGCKRVALAVAAAFLPSGYTYALPTGENVVNGDVTVSRPTTQTMQINQGTQKGIVEWQGFSIAPSEHVNITQPNASAALLNRVVGNNPSEIFGRLTANGQVFLVNNAGVLFAPGASVEVGSLFASSLSISNDDFLGGSYRFYNSGNAGSVVNQGTIITPGGYTALAGPQVRNDGVIVARSGSVALAAGDRVSLDMIGDGLISVSVDQAALNASVVNTGRIEADGGAVVLTARSANALLDTVINTSGVIRANALLERNGEIVLDGGGSGAVQVAGTVEAFGGNVDISAGGTLNVGSTVCCFPTRVTAATQDISAGSITVGGGAQVNGFGSQTITTPGTLLVRGGVLSGEVGFFNYGSGEQRVNAGNIVVRGGTGNGTSAWIASRGTGNQVVDTSRLELIGSSSGMNNNAAWVRTDVGNQTVNVAGDIIVTAHVAGDALLQGSASGLQTIHGSNVSIANGMGGTNSFGTIRAGHQEIHVDGNIVLTGGATAGTNGGVRMGGLSGQATDLQLYVGGDVIQQGGSAPDNSAIIGSTGSAAVTNNILIDAGGRLVLNQGSGSGARIGNGSALAGGNIEVHADGGIEMNGVTQSTSIRTLGNVQLEAPTITQAANGFIIANALTTTSTGATNLAGPNQLTAYNGTSGGDLALNNTRVLTVTGLNAFNAALTNQGDVTVSGPWNSFGAAITTKGVGSDLIVNNVMTSNGALNVNVAGDIAVTAVPAQSAMLRSFGGQNISARSLAVTSNGGFASVWNSGPNAQTISLTGGTGLDVQTLSPGGFAQVSADGSGSQTINVVNGDHINVEGLRGGAWIINPGGMQTLSITGSGANAITVGRAGALGFSQIRGGAQNITAGAAGESGSISIVGADANATFTGFSSDQRVGGTQSVSTSGTLRISGGNAPNQPPAGFATGLFHNGSGQQTVNAANIEMQGGSSGVNNTAIIISSGGAGTIPAGNQVINAAGDVELAGGSGTSNNTAIIVSFADQTVTAGNIILAGGASGASNGAFINSTAAGNQAITASGAITVRGGAGTANSAGMFHTGSGLQTVNAARVELHGGSAGSNNGAFINLPGAGAPGGQLINVSGNIEIAGGPGGNAGIGSGVRQQTIFADNIHITNSAGGGINSVGFIQGGHQEIHAAGDVTLTARASGGDLAGVRIGGNSANPTDLRLFVGGDLVLTGGTTANNGVGIGSTAAAGVPPLENNITINAQGSVILNSGVPTSGARIGSPQTVTGPGSISITAGGDVNLNGVDEFASIRTLGTATLNAANISEAAKGRVIAGTLNIFTSGNTALTGANEIANFNGSSGGDMSLTNTGALTVSGLNAGGDATLTNSGAVNVTGPWFSFGATDVTTTGGGLTLTNSMSSGGAMALDVGGALTVSANGAQTGQLISNAGGQIIDAQSVDVRAQNGGFALINSIAGNQSITATGGSVDVQALSGGGTAQIFTNPGSSQTIRVVDGDHLNVNGANGFAGIFSGGTQTLSITGSGANAITVGSLGARGPSNVGSLSHQNVTAGLAGENGSITIVGSDAQRALAGFVSNPSVGGTQTVSTSGTISITGGRAAPQLGNFPAGIFHNGTGLQTINAARLELRGGPSGSNNAALISVPGGGVPANAGAQLINVSGDIDIAAGPGGNAGILGSGVRQQTIFADNIHITNSAGGGINSVGFIQGGHQEIHAAGDVTLTARASGGDLPGVRIGGNSTNPTDLRLFVGGDLVLAGGTAVNNGVGIGSTASVGGLANNITIEAGGSVILNSGTLSGTGARIGSPAAGTGPGNIEIRAGNAIELNGVAQGTAIRTLDTATLVADHITEGPNGFIIAGTLNTATAGNASLTGPNQVSNFSASSAAGDVLLNNTASLLTVTSITAQGISVSQAGALDIVGNVTAVGAQNIGATGDIHVGADGHAVEVRAGGPITMSSGGNLAVSAGSAAGAHALVFSSGDINLTVGGFLTIDGSPTNDNWARIQTETRDSAIYVYFPNLSSGGYFVNGIEGELRDGHTGFLAGSGVAAPGQQFFTTYGAP